MDYSRSISEPERAILDMEIGLTCRIYGHAPVQADGRILTHLLYFRARHNGWSFAICINRDIDPSFLREGDKQGFFSDGEYQGYCLWGSHGTNEDASYMPYAVAEQIIRDCARQYLTKTGQRS